MSEPVSLCGAPKLELPSFDAHGRPNGHVTFAYASAAEASQPPIFGWLLVGYRYGSAAPRATTTPR